MEKSLNKPKLNLSFVGFNNVAQFIALFIIKDTMEFWFDIWSVQYNVLLSLADVLLGFCGGPGYSFGESLSFFFKRNNNFFCFNVIKINHVIEISFLSRDFTILETAFLLLLLLSMTLSVCSRFISFCITIITLFILICQGFTFILQTFIIWFSIQSLM